MGMCEFDEVIEVFHGNDMIEDSIGTCVEKHLVRIRRETAENQARAILSRKWGTWSYMDLCDVIELVNCNGFGDTNMRFSSLFLRNRRNIERTGIDITREALLSLLDDEYDLGDRVKGAQRIYGSSAQGMFSSFLYIKDPSVYSPRFKRIVHNLNRFDLVSGPNLKTTMGDYRRYCEVMKGIEQSYEILPQLTDYVLTTWIDVWEKYR